MKRFFALCFASLIAVTSTVAQRPAADEIKTSKGILTIQPILHASMVLTWDNKTIYIDPYGGAKAFKDLPAPDYIFITDIHPDHFDLTTLNAIETSKAMLIVPQAVAEKLPDLLKSKSIAIENSQTISDKGIKITAIAMYNLPEAKDAMHTRGRGNGYVLTMGGKTIYISGDTEDIPEMRYLKNIDVAFVCMNLPYTMDIKQAASAVLEFKPAIVYPYHYRGKDGLSDTEAFKKLVNEGNKDIEVRLRNWYPEY
jgi:L-ascorbate metabolism protein UlaG (beta-lactamase superfamily)